MSKALQGERLGLGLRFAVPPRPGEASGDLVRLPLRPIPVAVLERPAQPAPVLAPLDLGTSRSWDRERPGPGSGPIFAGAVSCAGLVGEGVPGIVGGFPKGEENRGGSRGPDSGLESGSKNPNRETTTMKRKYEKKGPPDKAGLRELLAKDGRDYLLPLVNVFALAGGALDQIIDVIGRAAIEAVLDISAADVAGEKQPGKERKGAGAAYHGRQRGRVYLADRAVRVEKPRLRSPGEGEIAIPAYEALRRPSGLGERMLELLLAGLSTRSYGKAIGQMAETAGVSKSSVSRQAAEAAGERLKELAERPLDDRDYLIVYVDGIQFGGHHVLAALGVDDKGNKRVLGVREGARPGLREGEAVRP